MQGDFRVGDWLVRPDVNELNRNGEKKSIEPKVMDVLIYLSEHAGEVLSKERLIQAVWPDTFVTDDALKYSIVSLRKALGDDANEPRYIRTIPRRGYQLVAEVQSPEAGSLPRPLHPGKTGPKWLWAGVITAGLLLLAAGTWALMRSSPDDGASPAPRDVRLTTSIFREGSPALSPDGQFLAFSGNDEKDNWDIYVKEIGGPGLIQLTDNLENDTRPLWSPDGRQILFQRTEGGRRVFLLKSPLGGGEKRLTEFPIEEDPDLGASWSPDGQRLAITLKNRDEPLSIWEVSLDSLNRRQLTHPPSGYYGDNDPAYSPDGRYLAFVRRQEWRQSTVYVLSLSGGDLQPVTDFGYPNQPAWTSDGREIVFSVMLGSSESFLWRVPVRGGTPVPIPTRGDRVRSPSIREDRLVYVSHQFSASSDIWRLNLHSEGPAAPEVLMETTAIEAVPHVSPDGMRIAYVSDSSGPGEIWVCDRDGRNSIRLTDTERGFSSSPRWSPDGRSIVFDSDRSGNYDVYVMTADGGALRQLTQDPALDVRPRFSRDGRWIYFGSNRGGGWHIWKLPSDGGDAEQVTSGPGAESCEGPDGSLYFCELSLQQGRELNRKPPSGGPETLVLKAEGWRDTFWDLTDRGVYFLDLSTPQLTLRFLDWSTGKVNSIANIDPGPGFLPSEGISVSSDDQWLYFTLAAIQSDIRMNENFR